MAFVTSNGGVGEKWLGRSTDGSDDSSHPWSGVTTAFAAPVCWSFVLGATAVFGLMGCLGGGPALPDQPTLGGTTSTSGSPTGGGGSSATGTTGVETTSGTTSDASATGADETSSTGSAAICGNGMIEDGEPCDGMAGQTETCESLGYTAGVLGCTECGFDASDCGAPPGMVRVAGGVFEMGSEGSDPSFAPVRQVNVDTFFIDIEEVTVQEYSECVSAMSCAPSSEITSYEPYYCNYMVGGKEEHPINCVNWYEAVDYCEWAGGRLPTEAEWEKAARGQDARVVPWGGPPGSVDCATVWMDEGGYGYGCATDSTGPVGTRSPDGDSPAGARDMAGNVAEWVNDWYAAYDGVS
jgi:formylglycine-generating enzyme required for sulfatase activity